MALDDEDRQEIARLIAESRSAAEPPTQRRRPTGPDPAAAAGADWDRLSPRDQQSYIRQVVEDRLAELDAEAERADLKRENEELRRALQKWEQDGKQGKKPTRESIKDDKRTEETPTIVSKAFKYLFGEATATGR